MQEIFENIKERLEEASHWETVIDEDGYAEDVGEVIYLDKAIEIVNQVAEEYKDKYVSIGAFKQVAWERDIAIEQLHELGYEFGQKIDRNDGWIPCSSGEMPKAHNEVWITYKWNDGSIHVGRDRVIHGEWYCTKREAIIAWKYMKAPAPYKPKGEK